VDQLLFRTRHITCTTGGIPPFSNLTESHGRNGPGPPEWVIRPPPSAAHLPPNGHRVQGPFKLKFPPNARAFGVLLEVYACGTVKNKNRKETFVLSATPRLITSLAWRENSFHITHLSYNDISLGLEGKKIHPLHFAVKLAVFF
jgi:hypothetical protein